MPISNDHDSEEYTKVLLKEHGVRNLNGSVTMFLWVCIHVCTCVCVCTQRDTNIHVWERGKEGEGEREGEGGEKKRGEKKGGKILKNDESEQKPTGVLCTTLTTFLWA